MKTKLLLFIVLLFSLYTNAQVWEWAKAEPNDSIGNSSSDYDDAHHSAVDASGNLYVLGDYNDSLYLNGIYRASGNGSYLAKYNATGNLTWYLLIKANDPYGRVATATDLVVNSDGVYITGFLPDPQPPYSFSIGTKSYLLDTAGYGGKGYLYASQFYFCKLNFNGGVVWNKVSKKAYMNGFLSSPTFAADNDGNIILSGIMGRNTCCNLGARTFKLGTNNITDSYNAPYNYNTFSLKYNKDGSLLWSRFAHTLGSTYQDADYIEVLSSVCDSNNDLWLYMRMQKSVKFGNITYTTDAVNGDQSELIIGKMSAAGSWQFIKEVSTYADANRNKNKMITADASGNIYVLTNLIKNYGDAYLNGNILVPYENVGPQPYLLKYNSGGNLLWYKNFGSNQTDYANVIHYYNNNLYLSGSVSIATKYSFGKLTVPPTDCNSASGVWRYFTAKADTSGDFIWADLLCSFYSAQGFSVSASGNDIYTTGFHGGGILNLGNLTPGLMPSSYAAPFVGKFKDQYVKVGAITPVALCAGSSITIPFTSYGLTFSAANKFIAQLSDLNGDFTSPLNIGSVTSTGSGSIAATIPATLPYGSGYVVRIKSSDTLKTGYNYYAYADTPYKITVYCPAPSSGFAATNITSNSATLNWNIVDCGKGYKVQYRKQGTTAWTTALVTTNTGSLLLTGLSANTTYQWRVATKCKPSTVVYSGYSSIKTFKTNASFGVNSLNDNSISVQTKTPFFKLYPNPANHFLTVQFSTHKTGSYTIELTDASGKILQTKKGSISYGENKVTMDISRYANGVYFIHLTNDEFGKQTLSVTKE